MKKLVTFGIFVVIASLAWAEPPQVQKKTFTAKVRTKARPSPSAPPMKKQDTEGVLPRAARGGNPFQMLNPKAPAVYGKSEDNVVVDADTGKWKGIKLFSILF